MTSSSQDTGLAGSLGVELRIHGVGGSSPEALLGEADRRQVRLLHGEADCGTWARTADGKIRGFVWGPLTSGSKVQALWILLFPFTLLNVAGWMHRRVDGDEDRAVTWIRGVVTILGVGLTITWTLWLATILVDELAYQAARDVESADSSLLVPAGCLLAGLLVAGWRISGLKVYGALAIVPVPAAWIATQFGEDDVRVGLGLGGVVAVMAVIFVIAGRTRERFDEHRPPGASAAHHAVSPRRGWRDNERLNSGCFFDHPKDSATLLVVHAVAVAVTVALLAVRAFHRADSPRESLGFGGAITGVVALQLALIAVLLLLSLRPLSWRSGWRVAGPAAAATLALMVTNGVFAGVAIWVRKRFELEAAPGSEMAFLDVYTVVVVACVVGLLTLGLPFFLRPAEPRLEVDADWRARVARRERLAQAFRNIDLPLSGFCLGMLVAGSVVAWSRLEAEGWNPFGWSLDAGDQESWVVSLGSWALPAGAVAIPGTIRLLARSHATRRNIGNAWDVMTFWPRRFHPLGVRPYAERAVPLLQGELGASVHDQGSVVVSAHSQGAILAYAAIAGLDDVARKNVSLITYGAPLATLHGQFFPHYFDRADFAEVADSVHCWRNYYRVTDHIGRATEVASIDAPPIDDPATQVPSEVPGETDLEQDIPPRMRISGHNDYRREHRVKKRVLALRGRTGST